MNVCERLHTYFFVLTHSNVWHVHVQQLYVYVYLLICYMYPGIMSLSFTLREKKVVNDECQFRMNILYCVCIF